jgi:hypothetical protein
MGLVMEPGGEREEMLEASAGWKMRMKGLPEAVMSRVLSAAASCTSSSEKL